MTSRAGSRSSPAARAGSAAGSSRRCSTKARGSSSPTSRSRCSTRRSRSSRRAARSAGVRTDVSRPDSVEALADAVFERYGACHLLFNNAGVTSGGGGLPWEQEPNDWRWCFGVNVFGVANGVLAFVPRMIASGEAGRDRQHVVGRRRDRAGSVRVGVRREQGGDQLLHRGVRAPARRQRHQARAPRSSTRRAACSTPGSGPRSATVRRSSRASASTRRARS